VEEEDQEPPLQQQQQVEHMAGAPAAVAGWGWRGSKGPGCGSSCSLGCTLSSERCEGGRFTWVGPARLWLWQALSYCSTVWEVRRGLSRPWWLLRQA
jgi:hypothetical protein